MLLLVMLMLMLVVGWWGEVGWGGVFVSFHPTARLWIECAFLMAARRVESERERGSRREKAKLVGRRDVF